MSWGTGCGVGVLLGVGGDVGPWRAGRRGRRRGHVDMCWLLERATGFRGASGPVTWCTLLDGGSGVPVLIQDKQLLQ